MGKYSIYSQIPLPFALSQYDHLHGQENAFSFVKSARSGQIPLLLLEKPTQDWLILITPSGTLSCVIDTH